MPCSLSKLIHSNFGLLIFSSREVDDSFKNEFLEFLGNNISEIQQEIIVLNEQLICQPNFTFEDFVLVHTEIIEHFTDIINFNKFSKKYFDTYLISEETKNEIRNNINVGKLFTKILKLKKK